MRAPSSVASLARRLRPSGWVFVAALVVGGSALAYVLPGHAVIRRSVDARVSHAVSKLRVTGTLTFEHASQKALVDHLALLPEGGQAKVDGRITLQSPLRCRVDAGATDPGDPRRLSAVSSNGKRSASGPESLALANGLEQACAMIAMSGSGARASLEAKLRQLGVNTGRTSLARFGGQVAYVVGDDGDGAGQFWVYKDSFQPARLRWVAKDGSRWDVRLVDWGSASAGNAFPRVLEVFVNGQRQVRFDALASTQPAKLDADLFKTGP